MSSPPAAKQKSSGDKKHADHHSHATSTPKPTIVKTNIQQGGPKKKEVVDPNANKSARGRKGVPSDGKSAPGKGKPGVAANNSRAPQATGGKRDRKARKKQPKQNPFLMWLGYGPDVVLRDRRAVDVAQALDLRQYHLRVLKSKFDAVDIDGSGSLDSQELFESVGETRTPLTDRLFELLDLQPTGTVEFDDYVRVIGTYCMFTKDEILKFCFRCFDHDDSGTIDEKEFCELCKVVNNAAPLFPGNFQKALDEFDVNEDGLIDYSEFVELDRRYPLILFPAFKLQDMLQKHTLGESTWVEISEAYHAQKKIEEYKATHGGKLPPEPIVKRILKTLLPCMYVQKVHIKIGAA